MTNKPSANIELIKTTVEALNECHPTDLVQVLTWIAQRYRIDAQELRNDWQDETAGKVWDIAAEGLEKTADSIQKYWDTL